MTRPFQRLRRKTKKNKCVMKIVIWGVSFLGILYVSLMKSALLLVLEKQQEEQRHMRIENGVKKKPNTDDPSITTTTTTTAASIQSTVTSIQNNSTSRSENDKNDSNSRPTRDDDYDLDFHDRFIIFKRILSGQGTGNMMNGLLAAHLLGQEFNRTVCVEQGYTQFHAAFESIHPYVIQHCPKLVENDVHLQNHLQVLTHRNGHLVDECNLQQRLANRLIKVISFLGNSYPRWPLIKKKNLFFQHYRARPELLNILPHGYGNNNTTQNGFGFPSTVVHLRAPDPGGSDRRKGLDEASLVALGQELSLKHGSGSDNDRIFLVTNRVDWYKRFEDQYGWGHPHWDSVAHSSSGIAWLGNNGTGIVAQKIPQQKNFLVRFNTNKPTKEDDKDAVDHDIRNLQMWADWYMLLHAKTIYHTHSDFSNSAIHWMGRDSSSFIIDGYNTASKKLMLLREHWIRDGPCPALKDRTRGGGDGVVLNDDEKGRLQHCKSESIT